MFKESGLTVNKVMCMVAGFCLRYGITFNARKSLIKLIKTCAGPNFYTLNVSHDYFSKTFDPPDDKIIFHYYYESCYRHIYSSTRKEFKSSTKLCEFCSSECTINLSCDNFFLTIDLQFQ